MKSIDLSISEKFLEGSSNKALYDETGFAGFFEHLLNQGLSSKHPQGQVPFSKGKILARIQTKLDDLKPEKKTILEVEEAEFDLIKAVFLDENTTWGVPQMQVVVEFANAIEQAQK